MPQDRFINLGIYHGVQDSAISVMTAEGLRILEAAPQMVAMPSVIFMYNNGVVDVGFGARDAILKHSGLRGQGVKRYLPRLHLDVTYDFPGANRKLTGAEVCGFVIGKLLEVYRRAYPENDSRACVISVPTDCPPHTYQAISAAGRLAGLEQVIMFQELARHAQDLSTSLNENGAWRIMGGEVLRRVMALHKQLVRTTPSLKAH